MHIYEELFSKTQSPNLGLTLETQYYIWNGAELLLEKSSSIDKQKQIESKLSCRIRPGYRTGTAQASRVGDREVGSWSNQTTDFYNWFLSLPILALGITKIALGLVGAVSG